MRICKTVTDVIGGIIQLFVLVGALIMCIPMFIAIMIDDHNAKKRGKHGK